MSTLTITLPDEAEPVKTKLIIAYALFDHGILSSGQAANLCGITRKAFLSDAGKYGISVFGESVSDFDDLQDLGI